LYRGKEPIFEAYGVEMEIERALGRKIWLKSGGYIVIDQTEALVAVDVNTGRFVGRRNPEETILQTNIEAIKEIVYQLRLRNIGGIIIIDFIDMEREESRDKVYNALLNALRHAHHENFGIRPGGNDTETRPRKPRSRSLSTMSLLRWQRCDQIRRDHLL
jgi:ribonuclease G